MQSSKAKTLGLLLLGIGALHGCDSGSNSLGSGPSEAKDEVGPICAACGPSTGGETGDFGGELVDCTRYLEDIEIDDDEAAQVSRAELERRLSAAVDVPYTWKRYMDPNPRHRALEASGYESTTRLQATMTAIGPFRFRRQIGCSEQPKFCDDCGSRVEVDVRVDFATADGSIQAVAEGVVEQAVADSATTPGAQLSTTFNTSADLRDVVGTLRFEIPEGVRPHGRLQVSGWLLPDLAARGELMIFLDVDLEHRMTTDLPSIEGGFFFPLQGSFNN